MESILLFVVGKIEVIGAAWKSSFHIDLSSVSDRSLDERVGPGIVIRFMD